MNTTLDAAMAEVRRRAPLFLNSSTIQQVPGHEPMTVTFADDHMFAMELPAWALRAIVASQQPAAVSTGIGQDAT